MPQPSRVKKQLETAAKAKIQGASQGEARGTVGTWETVCSDPEATSDLRSIAVFYRDALSAAIVNGNGPAQETALAALSSIAGRYQ
jgi:hypothetical protein